MNASLQKLRHSAPLAPTIPIPKIRYVYRAILLVFLLVFLYSLQIFLNDAVRFPVVRVEVGGQIRFVNKPQLMQIVKKHTQKGFFGLNIEEIREEIVSLAWVKNAYVRRVLPDRLHVNIIERKASLQWNDTGLIDGSGVVYYPPQLREGSEDTIQWQARFSHLPHLRGIDERSGYLQERFKEYNGLLNTSGLKLLGLYEDGRRSQTLLLNDNITVRLGYEQTGQRLRRFEKLYSKYVAKSSASNLQFDMRYTNGFTVARAGLKTNSTTGYY